MKVSLNWLRELVELPSSVSELVDLLTLAGVEVNRVTTLGCAIPRVVVAQIRESTPHPNADRLSVCQVDDGSGQLRQIVCGAKNYRVGDKVPLALPGAELPGAFKIKVGKLRGVESQGMLCSAEELGLPKGEDGLWILPPDAPIGQEIGTLFPGDTVLDLEITPNRADLLSVSGIVREIAALTGKTAYDPLATRASLAWPIPSVTIENPALCPHYLLRAVHHLQVGPSPDWLRGKLEASGLRAINNIVDLTNFVLLEIGQPLHAFDADRVRGSLQVRSARAGETLKALDGKTYSLQPGQLVIADAERVVAIAGVMGGEETSVTAETKNVLLEAATFDPQTVRRTARQLGLSSDSSYRFERGVDAEKVALASTRATELFREIAGGEIGELWLGGTVPQSAVRCIPLRSERLTRILGIEVPVPRVRAILQGFGLEEMERGWSVPSFRPDLTREIDLIEEIARVVGLKEIPGRVQARFSAESATDRAFDREMHIRRALAAQGLHEARHVVLVAREPRALACTKVPPENLQRLKNPMIEDQVTLRPHLLHGLLEALSRNLRAGSKSIRLFEFGRVFSRRSPEESTHAAILLSGTRGERNWREKEERPLDLFDLKAMIRAAFGASVQFVPETDQPALALALRLEMGSIVIGHTGQFWPAEARELGTDGPVIFGEIDLPLWAKARAELGHGLMPRYQGIPRFPAVTRDIALLAPEHVTHAEIARAFAGAHEPLLQDFELFDVFTDPTGEKVPAGQKSLAYSLTYRSAERTLTADEANAAHGRVKAALKSAVPVTLRE